MRASRAKLAHALTEAGLKTQAALAERIADIEGLDAAPKDVVNRVFRELPVDPTTLERRQNNGALRAADQNLVAIETVFGVHVRSEHGDCHGTIMRKCVTRDAALIYVSAG